MHRRDWQLASLAQANPALGMWGRTQNCLGVKVCGIGNHLGGPCFPMSGAFHHQDVDKLLWTGALVLFESHRGVEPHL